MTGETVPQEAFANVSLEDVPDFTAPKKPMDMLYSSKPLFTGSPNSLNRMMCNRSSLKAAHSAFVRDFQERKSKSVGFIDTTDYGYGYDEPSVQPPTKKRRFERRNSKTPAMLMAMSAAALDLKFLQDKDEEDKKEADDDDFDGGLEIAEELVKQLQQRRRSNLY